MFLILLLAFALCCASFTPKPTPVIPHPHSQPSPAFDSCECAGGSISTWPYETVPISSSGAGCIGGCGGSRFEVHDFATTVSVLKAWTGGDHNGLSALYIELFNGKVFSLGSVPARGPDAQITFATGETIVGDIELCGNGVGSLTGFIKFQTSAGQKFQVGDEHTPYYFPSGNSFLTGFFGQAGSDIDHLGILMMKPIVNGELEDVNYPTLSNYAQGLSPQIYKTVLCNDDHTTPQSNTVSFEKTVGTTYHWSITVSFSIGGSITVTAGLPDVAQVSEEFHWEVGLSSTYDVSVDTTKTETMSFPVTVAPREKVFGSFSWWDSVCNVPYTAKLVYTYSDHSNYTFAVSDTYLGAYITDVISDYHSVPLGPTESCP